MVSVLDPVTTIFVFAIWLFILSILFSYLFKRYNVTKNPVRNGKIFGAILAVLLVIISILIGNFSLLSGIIFAIELFAFLFVYSCWILLKRVLS